MVTCDRVKWHIETKWLVRGLTETGGLPISELKGKRRHMTNRHYYATLNLKFTLDKICDEIAKMACAYNFSAGTNT